MPSPDEIKHFGATPEDFKYSVLYFPPPALSSAAYHHGSKRFLAKLGTMLGADLKLIRLHNRYVSEFVKLRCQESSEGS